MSALNEVRAGTDVHGVDEVTHETVADDVNVVEAVKSIAKLGGGEPLHV